MNPNPDELRKSAFSGALMVAYRARHLRDVCFRLAMMSEGGSFFSHTVRQILEVYHRVRVGAYSYGECLIPNAFPPGVVIGRYASIASGVRVFVRNHPMERLSMHPLFFNSRFGFVPQDTLEEGTLTIEHDAWIGANAIVTPGCRRVGLGAVVGAGAVVTRDVPDFAIVVGNPAKVLRFRFPDETCDAVRASRWWEKSFDELRVHMKAMNESLNAMGSQHPLLRSTSLEACV